MDWSKPKQVAAFFDLHRDNPREGPGDRASTARALAAVTLAANPAQIETVLDLACGPGMQTRHLVELLPARANITALDIHAPFVDEVNNWINERQLGHRVRVVQGDMSKPPVAPGSVDLIWCEGAAYMLGIGPALETWRPFLRGDNGGGNVSASPVGFVALSEPVFLTDELPPAVVENWAEYPAMTDAQGIADRVAGAGFNLLESFTLSHEAWAAYYDPLQQRVTALRDKYAKDPESLSVIEEGQQEIDAWHNYGEYFSYAFIVVQPA